VKKILRNILIVLLIILIPLVGYFIYMQGLYGVHPTTIEYYKQLNQELTSQGYSPNHFVLSTTRPKWFNDILVRFGGAASRSQHLQSTAIDIVVMDVNGDGRANSKDVDIVYAILHRKIVKNKGGIGTYKNEYTFFDRQMVHFDSRGYRARWHR
jgi:uncharacterized protein YcbK (DUF882 family)